MSLISLTFGNKNNAFSVKPMMEVIQPWHNLKVSEGVENKLVVKKFCGFYKLSEIYIVGKITSGVVQEGMVGSVNGKSFRVIEVDCKMKGAPIAGEGMTVGLLVEGVQPNDLQKENEILFQN